MIRLYKSGLYKLIETKHAVKVLYLDSGAYVWIKPPKIGHLLVLSRHPHRSEIMLSLGHYHLYHVEDEPHLSDHIHLELEAGSRCWQGYLLQGGLPTTQKSRVRILPTYEVITGNPKFNFKITASLRPVTIITRGS